MKGVLVAMSALYLLACGAYAQDQTIHVPTDPVEILKKADAAARAIKAARYKAVVEGTGAVKARVPSAQGTVIMAGWGSDVPKMFRVDTRFKDRRHPDTRDMSMGCDGQQYYLIDHQTKMVHVGRTWAVWGANARIVLALLTNEFTYPEPFTDEINGVRQELKGSKMVGDEDCYEVYIEYAVANARAVWCFSKQDFLPRSRHDLTGTPSSKEEGGQLRTMTDVQADPPLSEDAFKVVIPEGYTRTDHAAP
jgi:hypothetical protein